MDNTILLGILFASASFWLLTHGLLALLEFATVLFRIKR